MPTVPIYPSTGIAATSTSTPAAFGLPQLLQTPSGLALLEIQGTINTSVASHASESGPSSHPIGKLVFPDYDAADDAAWGASASKRVYLYVGKYQRLTGELKKLPRPVAVLRRRQEDVDGDGEALEVAEIVRWKVIFAHRPEPVGGEQNAVEG